MSAVTEQVELVAEEPSGAKGKVFIGIGVLFVLLLAGGASWWWFFARDVEPAPPEDGEIVMLEPMTTTTGEDTLRHARVGIAIVLVDGEDPEVIEPRLALLQDALLREVAAMSADQLRSVEGSEQLRQRLSQHAIDIWGEEVVRRIVLTELLLQ